MRVDNTSKSRWELLLLRLWKHHAITLFFMLSGIFIIMLLTASVQMVHLAISSQPECVQHQKVAGEAATEYLAAKSSC